MNNVSYEILEVFLKGKNHTRSYARTQLTESTAWVPILCLHRNPCGGSCKKSKCNCEAGNL